MTLRKAKPTAGSCGHSTEISSARRTVCAGVGADMRGFGAWCLAQPCSLAAVVGELASPPSKRPPSPPNKQHSRHPHCTTVALTPGHVGICRTALSPTRGRGGPSD